MQPKYHFLHPLISEVVTKSLQGDRTTQEDAFGVAEWKGGQLYLVCDGLGGFSGGEVASKAFVDLCVKFAPNYRKQLAKPKVLNDFLDTVTEGFKQLLIEKNEEDANTTVTMAIVLEDCWISIHIGDSRIYHFKNNRLSFRSRDHSYLEQLLKQGKLSEEQFSGHPQQNILNRSLGMNHAQYDIKVHPKLEAHDTLVLATDGFWQYLSVDEIVSVCLDPNTLSALCDTAYERGHHRADNITAIVARYRKN